MCVYSCVCEVRIVKDEGRVFKLSLLGYWSDGALFCFLEGVWGKWYWGSCRGFLGLVLVVLNRKIWLEKVCSVLSVFSVISMALVLYFLFMQNSVLLFFSFSDLIGKKTKGTKRYVPQRNSVAYALLITLYRYAYAMHY